MYILVINLNRSKDRREYMEKQLKKMNLKHEFINAIDGEELTDDELRKYSDLDSFMSNKHWVHRGKGTIGCAISHQKAYKIIIEKKIQRAIILEDDVFLKKPIPKILNKLNSLKHNIDDKELILFYTSSITSEGSKPIEISLLNGQKVDKKYSLLYPLEPRTLYSTAAYSISYQSAKIFLEEFPKVERVSDAWGVFLDKNIFSKISCIVPFPIALGDFDTTRSKEKKIDNFLYSIFIKLRKKRYDFFNKKYIIKNL